MRGQVDDVVDVMKSNVSKVIERGDRLEDLQDKSGKVSQNFQEEGTLEFSKGGNSTIFLFGSLHEKGQLLKEEIFSYWSKFFPITVASYLEGLLHPRKLTGSHDSCFPL